MIFDCIKNSIEIYNGENIDYNYRNVFYGALSWFGSKEGPLFWYILHTSYSVKGICDYILIIKLYKEFGARCFEIMDFELQHYYEYHFNGITLSDEAVEQIFNVMRRYLK